MATETQRLKLTTAEAVAMIRKAAAGSRFSLHVRCNLPIADSDDRIFEGVGGSYLNLTRKDALRLAGDLVSQTLEARGARVPMSVRFDTETGRRNYWLG